MVFTKVVCTKIKKTVILKKYNSTCLFLNTKRFRNQGLWYTIKF